MNGTPAEAILARAKKELESRYINERGSLLEFIKTYRRDERKEEMDMNRHISLICEKLEKVYR